MRIVACVGVKDEVELIEPLIAHLRAIGADVIIACDMYSTDGSAELLRTHARDDDFVMFQISDREDMETWAQANLAHVREVEADWALFLDADELPIPASGSLKDCAGLDSADALLLDRFNVILTVEGPALPAELAPTSHDELLMVVEPMPHFWTESERDPELSWMRSRIAGRVMARPDRIGTLTLGAHDIVAAGDAPIRCSTSDDLVVAHLPFTTRERFERKVANIRTLLAAHEGLFVESYGRHWRRWAALAEAGRLGEEFDRMVFDAAQIVELRDQRVIRTAAELFAERMAIVRD